MNGEQFPERVRWTEVGDTVLTLHSSRRVTAVIEEISNGVWFARNTKSGRLLRLYPRQRCEVLDV